MAEEIPAEEMPPRLLTASRCAGARFRDHAVAAAAKSYERHRHLTRLLPLSAAALADTTAKGTAAIVDRLARAAEGLARAGANCHWSYDANRHIAVLGALRAERLRLDALERRA